MTILKKIFRNITPLLLLLTLSGASFGDTIRLKNGGIIKGKVVGFSGGDFIISVGEGARRRELKFAASEVDSVQFDTVDQPPSTPVAPTQSPPHREPLSQPRVVLTEAKKTETLERPMPSALPVSAIPVEVRVRVLADNTSNGWTNSGWVVKKGQRIRIVADEGTISLGNGRLASASGIGTLDVDGKLLPNVPTGALIAVIGDDNNEFIYVGSEREFTATRDGALFLGINDGNLNDNSGALNVKIEIMPEKG